MSYRDDLEAAQARVAALERELSDTRAELAARDEAETALVATGETALVRGAAGGEAPRRWLGAPTAFEFERTLEGEIPESAQTDLVEKIRRVLGTVGATSLLPGSLAWTAMSQQSGVGPFVNVYITFRDGTTTIRAEEKLANLAGAIFGGVGGGVGGGGLMVAIAPALITPLLLPLTIPMWLGGTYAACRRLYRSRARRRADKLEQLVDELAEIAQEHIERARTSEPADEP